MICATLAGLVSLCLSMTEPPDVRRYLLARSCDSARRQSSRLTGTSRNWPYVAHSPARNGGCCWTELAVNRCHPLFEVSFNPAASDTAARAQVQDAFQRLND